MPHLLHATDQPEEHQKAIHGLDRQALNGTSSKRERAGSVKPPDLSLSHTSEMTHPHEANGRRHSTVADRHESQHQPTHGGHAESGSSSHHNRHNVETRETKFGYHQSDAITSHSHADDHEQQRQARIVSTDAVPSKEQRIHHSSAEGDDQPHSQHLKTEHNAMHHDADHAEAKRKTGPEAVRIRLAMTNLFDPAQQHSHARHHGHGLSETHARPVTTSKHAHHSFFMSYPPSCQRCCSAEDAAADILRPNQGHWWEGHSPQPPILRNRFDSSWSMSSHMTGDDKISIGYALFADLSQVWYRVNHKSSQVDAHFAHRPDSLGHHRAHLAARAYNEHIAEFAEAQNRPVGNGECWTLASEAIKAIPSDLPPPVPSVGRTHGSLIYEGKALAHGKQDGRWHGGDTFVRRGDIVEWKEAIISKVDTTNVHLGLPSHTQIVVRDAEMDVKPHDGERLLPAAIGDLEVVEQSHGRSPSRSTYDLESFNFGELWIYRPCSLSSLGLAESGASWPPPFHTFAPAS